MKVTKKRVIGCLEYFALLTFANLMYDYFFRPSDIDLVRSVSVAIGVSIGVFFVSQIFEKKEK